MANVLPDSGKHFAVTQSLQSSVAETAKRTNRSGRVSKFDDDVRGTNDIRRGGILHGNRLADGRRSIAAPVCRQPGARDRI